MRGTYLVDGYRESRELSPDEGSWGNDSDGRDRESWIDDDLWIEESPWADTNVSEALTLKYLGSKAILRS